jgi:hypothetical protein
VVNKTLYTYFMSKSTSTRTARQENQGISITSATMGIAKSWLSRKRWTVA